MTSLLLAAAACGGSMTVPPPKPPSVESALAVQEAAAIPVELGERLVAEASVMGMSVGTLDMRLSKPCGDGAADHWVLDSKLGTAGVLSWFNKTRGYTRTYLDKATLKPTQSTTLVIDGGEWRRYEIDFAGGEYTYRTEKSGGEKKTGQGTSPGKEPIYDTQTAYVLLRTWQPKAKEQSYFYVVLGKDLWRADVRFEGTKAMEVNDKKTKVLHVAGEAHRVDLKPGEEYEPRTFRLWLTDDEHRVPIKVVGDGSLGAIHFDLARRDVGNVCREASAELPDHRELPVAAVEPDPSTPDGSPAPVGARPGAEENPGPMLSSSPAAAAGSAPLRASESVPRASSD